MLHAYSTRNPTNMQGSKYQKKLNMNLMSQIEDGVRVQANHNNNKRNRGTNQ